MSDYKTAEVGHRVRITMTADATVTDGNPTTRLAFIAFTNSGERIYVPRDGMQGWAVTVERLPDPEPQWQPGDIVLSVHGGCFRRTLAGRWKSFAGAFVGDEIPARPLTLLARDGKPWGEQ